MSTAQGVGTSVNVKSPPEVWGRPGVGLEIDRCIRIRRVFTGIRHGYNDCTKLTTYHEVNGFCHGGSHLGQKKVSEASFTCCLL